MNAVNIAATARSRPSHVMPRRVPRDVPEPMPDAPGSAVAMAAPRSGVWVSEPRSARHTRALPLDPRELFARALLAGFLALALARVALHEARLLERRTQRCVEPLKRGRDAVAQCLGLTCERRREGSSVCAEQVATCARGASEDTVGAKIALFETTALRVRSRVKAHRSRHRP